MTSVLLRLVLVEKDGDQPRDMALGHVIKLPLESSRPYFIGRAPEVDILVAAPSVGRMVVRLILLGDGVLVEDLGSGGGSSLETNSAVTDRPHCLMEHGAVLRIGGVAFRVELLGGPDDLVS